MNRWTYTKGLHDLGNGVYAYLQPDGTWGWSNAGLITDGDQSLLVDTLFDLALTHEMLATMRRATKAAETIRFVVNTHANGDHCYGNELVKNAEIIASKACAEEMAEVPPEVLARMMENAPALGELGEYLIRCFGRFQFDGITLTVPTRTFENRLDVKIGDKTAQLIEVGPAHTRGDTFVYLPAERTVFTGDILFVEGTPIMWAGPISNWIRACDLILSLDVDIIVPGHGPVTDKHGVEQVKKYLEYIHSESRKRYDAGLSPNDAAMDIALGEFRSLTDKERIIANVWAIYREFDQELQTPNIGEVFALMARGFFQNPNLADT